VCRQAQLTSRYFYESFEGMEALFRAVYVDVNRQLMQATILSLASCQPEPEKLAEAALRTFLEFIREDPHRARVALIDAVNAGEGMSLLTGKASQDFAHLISGFMQQLFPHAADAGLDVRIISSGLVGSNISIATQWVSERCRTPLDVVLHNMLAIFKACIQYAQAQELLALARTPPQPRSA
jgi:AcrR family transcriptional regulator